MPFVFRLVGKGEGLYPVLWSATFALGPAMLALAVITVFHLGQNKPLERIRMLKIPLLIFYIGFLLMMYQAIRTMDQHQPLSSDHHENAR